MFVELAVTTNFSFLRGASHPHEYVRAAALNGMPAIGIADRNTLAGIVRAYDTINKLMEETGSAPRLLVGSRLVFMDGTPDILAYPTDRAAYGRLCRLLSVGKARAAKGECILTLDDLLAWQEGLLLAVMPPHPRPRKSHNDPLKKAWNNKNALPGDALDSTSPLRGGRNREAISGGGSSGEALHPTQSAARLASTSPQGGGENTLRAVLQTLRSHRPRPRLAGGVHAASGRRSAPPQDARAHGEGRGRAAARHQRCALSRSRAARIAGRRHLHPRACDARTTRAACSKPMPNVI